MLKDFLSDEKFCERESAKIKSMLDEMRAEKAQK